MATIYTRYFKSKYGELILGSYDDSLCLCDWRYRRMRSAVDQRVQKNLTASYKEGETPVLEAAVRQLEEYFTGERKEFDLPLTLAGSDFQKQVWRVLQQIGYGQTESYLGLASKLKNPQAIRAVAAANGANALAVFIPCHRVIGSDGSLTGYAGGIKVKERLLRLEAVSAGV